MLKLLIGSLPCILILFFISISISNSRKTIANFNVAFPKTTASNEFVVCIDPGHGDWDFGAIGINKSYEKDITLAVSLKLGDLLSKEDDFRVVYTRATDSIDWLDNANDSLKERIKISKISNADIFISIHCNYSNESKDVKGVETWYNPDDNESLNLSVYLQKALVDLNYTENRGVKSYIPGEELAVLELNDNTSTLLELGFLTNTSDEKYLLSESGQFNIAKALCDSIIEYKNYITSN